MISNVTQRRVAPSLPCYCFSVYAINRSRVLVSEPLSSATISNERRRQLCSAAASLTSFPLPRKESLAIPRNSSLSALSFPASMQCWIGVSPRRQGRESTCDPGLRLCHRCTKEVTCACGAAVKRESQCSSRERVPRFARRDFSECGDVSSERRFWSTVRERDGRAFLCFISMRPICTERWAECRRLTRSCLPNEARRSNIHIHIYYMLTAPVVSSIG